MIEQAENYLQQLEAKYTVAIKNRSGHEADIKLRDKVSELSEQVRDAKANLFHLKKIQQQEIQDASAAKQRQAKELADTKLQAARIALPACIKDLKAAALAVLQLEKVIGGNSKINAVIDEVRRESI